MQHTAQIGLGCRQIVKLIRNQRAVIIQIVRVGMARNRLIEHGARLPVFLEFTPDLGFDLRLLDFFIIAADRQFRQRLQRRVALTEFGQQSRHAQHSLALFVPADPAIPVNRFAQPVALLVDLAKVVAQQVGIGRRMMLRSQKHLVSTFQVTLLQGEHAGADQRLEHVGLTHQHRFVRCTRLAGSLRLVQHARKRQRISDLHRILFGRETQPGECRVGRNTQTEQLRLVENSLLPPRTQPERFVKLSQRRIATLLRRMHDCTGEVRLGQVIHASSQRQRQPFDRVTIGAAIPQQMQLQVKTRQIALRNLQKGRNLRLDVSELAGANRERHLQQPRRLRFRRGFGPDFGGFLRLGHLPGRQRQLRRAARGAWVPGTTRGLKPALRRQRRLAALHGNIADQKAQQQIGGKLDLRQIFDAPALIARSCLLPDIGRNLPIRTARRSTGRKQQGKQ